MNNFLQRLRVAIVRFMAGRHGLDELGLFTFVLGFGLSFVDMLFRTGFLSTLGFMLYLVTIFRMLSRNNAQRSAENAKFLHFKQNYKVLWKQFVTRTKNRREYKYFRCPGCKSLMRLKRGAGERDMTCPKCHTRFKQKA
ncbi:MAG: hypothetical protein Q4C54_03390 [Clostridia bacterium]|nr:hypothetical protein [Clostridia bacterium]